MVVRDPTGGARPRRARRRAGRRCPRRRLRTLGVPAQPRQRVRRRCVLVRRRSRRLGRRRHPADLTRRGSLGRDLRAVRARPVDRGTSATAGVALRVRLLAAWRRMGGRRTRVAHRRARPSPARGAQRAGGAARGGSPAVGPGRRRRGRCGGSRRGRLRGRTDGLARRHADRMAALGPPRHALGRGRALGRSTRALRPRCGCRGPSACGGRNGRRSVARAGTGGVGVPS